MRVEMQRIGGERKQLGGGEHAWGADWCPREKVAARGGTSAVSVVFSVEAGP